MGVTKILIMAVLISTKLKTQTTIIDTSNLQTEARNTFQIQKNNTNVTIQTISEPSKCKNLYDIFNWDSVSSSLLMLYDEILIANAIAKLRISFLLKSDRCKSKMKTLETSLKGFGAEVREFYNQELLKENDQNLKSIL